MRRRKFLETLLATGTTAWIAGAPSSLDAATLWQTPAVTPPPPSPEIKRVLILFKCHFDAGFIDTQANVVHRYFNEFFPKAINTAEQLDRTKGSGPDRANYTWTTGSWLLYEYLEQASPEQRKKMEQAIASNFIAWHALPFSWQTELMDPSLISGAIALSQSLDNRFGRKTTGAKMTDVPGHTRGIVSPLASAGVKFLDIGVNDASTPAVLPPLFRWQDPAGAQLVVSYHHHYGTIQVVPGSDVAYAIVMADDNVGPHSPEEIAAIYLNLRKQFPNAEIRCHRPHRVSPTPSSPTSRSFLSSHKKSATPGFTASPVTLSKSRAIAQSAAFATPWIASGKFQQGDATDLALLRNLLLEVEHTWGTDTKTWLDFDHYLPSDLTKMLTTKNYKVVQSSWQEKRHDLSLRIESLPDDLGSEVMQSLRILTAPRPQPIAGSTPSKLDFETPHFFFQLDEKTGAIRRLNHKSTSQEWAAQDHPLALFTYQTLSQKDYDAFFKSYVISTEDWAFKDFGKPNIERFGAVSKIWMPSLAQCEITETGRDLQSPHAPRVPRQPTSQIRLPGSAGHRLAQTGIRRILRAKISSDCRNQRLLVRQASHPHARSSLVQLQSASLRPQNMVDAKIRSASFAFRRGGGRQPPHARDRRSHLVPQRRSRTGAHITRRSAHRSRRPITPVLHPRTAAA